MTTHRQTDTALDPLFLHRWSPRAFDASAMPDEDLMTILDAGRWAPSSYNYQPWRFLYARRGDADWAGFLDILIPFNASWAKDASTLIYIISETTMGAPDKPNYAHSFDAGAAWACMALQAHMLNYHAHAMVGFDHDGAAGSLDVPDGWRVEAAIAIGRRGDPAQLPGDLQKREIASDRRSLSDTAFAGKFVR